MGSSGTSIWAFEKDMSSLEAQQVCWEEQHFRSWH